LHLIKKPQRVVIGFSLNALSRIQLLEKGTASLVERLAAAKRCIEMGFFVAFHFDPMFYFDNCESEYREVVRLIFDFVKDPGKIAWISVGAFRTMPSLKPLLRKAHSHLPLFSGELISGADGKLRYVRPLRVALYSLIREEFERHAPDVTLYLCMESPDVWEQTGMIRRIPEGLVKYLDLRAEEMLGI
jgi:spore photoproduct lyase